MGVPLDHPFSSIFHVPKHGEILRNAPPDPQSSPGHGMLWPRLGQGENAMMQAARVAKLVGRVLSPQHRWDGQ